MLGVSVLGIAGNTDAKTLRGDGVWPTGRRGGLLLPGPSVRHPGLQMEAFWVSSEEISNPHGR